LARARPVEGIALVALFLVPISTQSGEALQARVRQSSLVHTHVAMAEGLAPWVFGLAVVAGVLLWWNWDDAKATPPRAPKWVALLLAVAAVLGATGTIVQAVRIGHSGATATWSQVAGSGSPARSGDSDNN